MGVGVGVFTDICGCVCVGVCVVWWIVRAMCRTRSTTNSNAMKRVLRCTANANHPAKTAQDILKRGIELLALRAGQNADDYIGSEGAALRWRLQRTGYSTDPLIQRLERASVQYACQLHSANHRSTCAGEDKECRFHLPGKPVPATKATIGAL